MRRASEVPADCFALGHFHDGYYECEFVSPWTISAQNMDAKLAVVLQDWCSSDYLSQPFRPQVRLLGHDPGLPTNINLKRLLAEIGLELGDTFGTNAFPFIKSGPMNSKIGMRLLRQAFTNFVIPQIDTVKPKVAVLLGKLVYNAACEVFGYRPAQNLAAAVSNPIHNSDVTYVASVHTGSKIAIHRGWEQAVLDWREVGKRLR